LTPFERDRAIVELRKRGYTYRAIGKAVGMDGSAVMRALRRLQDAETRPHLPRQRQTGMDGGAVMRALRRLQAGGKGTRPRD